MYTRQQFIEEATTEANNIKLYATADEINKLDFIRLKPHKKNACIYGLMTGDCYSQRAAELIEKCAARYFDYIVMPMFGGTVDFESLAYAVNGRVVFNFFRERVARFAPHFSAIEVYIVTSGANNQNLIAYLKGKTNTLEL